MAIIVQPSTAFKKYIGKTKIETIYGKIDDFWYANSFRFEGDRWVIAIHSITRYTVVLCEVNKAIIRDFDEYFLDRIIDQISIERITEGFSPRNNPWDGDFYFSTSLADKSLIGLMNHKVQTVKVMVPWHDIPHDIYGVRYINTLLNETPVSEPGSRRNFFMPQNEMMEYLGCYI